MQPLQFDTHIDGFYSLATIRAGYPLLKIGKIFDLKCHLICAIDRAMNLHFIEHREQLPTDPAIYPPSYASTDHPNILFSIELLAIVKQTHHKHLNEEDIMQFFEQLESMKHQYSDAYALRPGVFLLRPFEPSPVYLIDLTVQNAKPKIIHEFGLANMITGWDDDLVVFSSDNLQGIFAHSFGLQKTKKLKFSGIRPIRLKMIYEPKLCVAIFKNMLEVLDLKRNCIIERSIFDSTFGHIISVSPKGSRLAHFYISEKNKKESSLELWDIEEDAKIRRREPVHLENLILDDCCIEFLNEELFICIRRWISALHIYRVEKYGVTKSHKVKVPHNFGHIKPIPNRLYEQSDLNLLVLDMNTFLIMTTDAQEGGYSKIESCHIEPISSTNLSQRSLALNRSSSNKSTKQSQIIKLGKIEKIELEMRTSLLFEEKVETIVAIGTWKTEKIGILYDSYKFCEYDLQSGKLEKRFVLSETERPADDKRIKYIDNERLILYSEHFVVVVNLALGTTLINLETLRTEYALTRMENILVSDEGRIILFYQQFEDDQIIIGQVDLESAELEDIIYLDSTHTPDEAWLIGDAMVAGRKSREYSTLLIWDLNSETLRLQKRFSPFTELKKHAGYEPFIYNVTKVNEQIIAFIAVDMVTEGNAILIYNWVEDRILATCKIHAEEILGVVNDELLVLSEEDFRLDFDTNYAKIPLRDVLNEDKQEAVKQLDFNSFGKFFLKFHKNCLEYLGNQRDRIVLMKEFLPHKVFIMRKRNRKLEILRFLRKELKDTYHPYVFQDILKIIVGE